MLMYTYVHTKKCRLASCGLKILSLFPYHDQYVHRIIVIVIIMVVIISFT